MFGFEGRRSTPRYQRDIEQVLKRSRVLPGRSSEVGLDDRIGKPLRRSFVGRLWEQKKTQVTAAVIGSVALGYGINQLRMSVYDCNPEAKQRIESVAKFEQNAEWSMSAAIAADGLALRGNCEADIKSLRVRLIENKMNTLLYRNIGSDDIRAHELIVFSYRDIRRSVKEFGLENEVLNRWKVAYEAFDNRKFLLASEALSEMSDKNQLFPPNIPPNPSQINRMKFVYNAWLEAGKLYTRSKDEAQRVRGKEYLEKASDVNRSFRLDMPEVDGILSSQALRELAVTPVATVTATPVRGATPTPPQMLIPAGNDRFAMPTGR